MKRVGGGLKSRAAMQPLLPHEVRNFFTKLFKQARNSSHGVFANQYWKCSW